MKYDDKHFDVKIIAADFGSGKGRTVWLRSQIPTPHGCKLL